MRNLIRGRTVWRRGAALGAGVLLMSGAMLSAPGAAAQPVSGPCPAAFPLDQVVDGLTGTGLTVERGTTPEPFTAKVLGVIEDGIAPGLDMIIADTDSPAIQRAGGIWAGMSGSPVYAEDGRLIGAVAYGLSLAPSSVAGIVPAADMYELLDRPGALTATDTRERTAVPSGMRQQMVRSGAATSSQADGGMRRLELPVAVSGLSSDRMRRFTDDLDQKVSDTRVYSAGSASSQTGSPEDIVPGGNFAAAFANGDFTAAGVGTTTAVCDDGTSLAFGHPFLWTGKSSMTVHPANAVYVQRDDTLGSYKIANPQGVVGTLDQDRIAGIRGKLGTAPTTIPITSTLTSSDDGRTREGATQVSLPDFLPLSTVYHMLSNFDRVGDFIGKGSSELRWTIDGLRASGAPFQVDVRNRYASEFDIAFESILDAANQVRALQRNRFESVKITSVRYAGSVSSDFRRYSVDKVLLKRPNGTLAPISTTERLSLVTGSRLNLRVVLAQHQNTGPAAEVDLSVIVPPATAGGEGRLTVLGGGGEGGHGDEGPGEGPGQGPNQPTSFDQLLAQLRGSTPNNSVAARLSFDGPTGPVERSARSTTDQVVSGFLSFPVRVVSAPRSLPAVVDGSVWKLRSSLSSGAPNRTFSYGDSTYRQLMGDFDGDGRTSPALFRNGTWRVRMSSTSTTSRVFTFGQTGDLPVVGDWNGDGRDDIGVYRQGRWLLRDSVSSGAPQRDFVFGSSSARPVVGDWDGDGTDSIGTYSAGTWKLRNSNSAGPTRWTFTYGRSGDLPVVGDWNRDGRDRPGVYRAGTWFARDALTSGSSSYVFGFGGSSSRPLSWH